MPRSFRRNVPIADCELVDLFARPERAAIERDADAGAEACDEEGQENGGMKIRQLMEILAMMDPEADVFVAFFYPDATSETFDIEEVTEQNGDAQIEIYEEEPPA